jgi:hypothetical protein
LIEDLDRREIRSQLERSRSIAIQGCAHTRLFGATFFEAETEIMPPPGIKKPTLPLHLLKELGVSGETSSTTVL